MIVEETKINEFCTVRIHDDAYKNRSPDEIKQIIKVASAIVNSDAKEKTA